MSAPRALMQLGEAARDRTSANRLTVWLLACVAVTLLLTFGSLVIGTSSIETSLGWILSPGRAVERGALANPLAAERRRLVGGALLGLAGGIAQGVFRNPLADPYLLGTASGAALGVTISLVAADVSVGGLAWASKLGITGAACLGAGGATLLTISLSRGVLQTRSLLLSGVVVAFLLSAITQLMLLAKPDIWRSMQSFLFGSTGFISWSSVSLLGTVFGLSIVPAVFLSRGLDALTLGEDTAQSLGLSLPDAAAHSSRHRVARHCGRGRRSGGRGFRRSCSTASRARDALGESSPAPHRCSALRRSAAASGRSRQPLADPAG